MIRRSETLTKTIAIWVCNGREITALEPGMTAQVKQKSTAKSLSWHKLFDSGRSKQKIVLQKRKATGRKKDKKISTWYSNVVPHLVLTRPVDA